MGRMMGSYDSDELDRPDLNKCPDCGCFFATEACPLCGKICPEEMRAGHRAKVKPPKKRHNSTGRVQFIAWYHSWWFILLMMFVMPLAGIILFVTSPYSKKAKIIITLIVVVLWAFLGTGLGFMLLGRLFEKPLVNDDIPRAEYVERCEPTPVERFYRTVAFEEDAYVTMELTVVERLEDLADGSGAVYFLCKSVSDGDVTILVRDCCLEGKQNYLPGDMLRVYGEAAGIASVYVHYTRTVELPCLNMAYCELIG